MNPEIQAFSDRIGAQVINLNMIEDLPTICRQRRKYCLVFDHKKTHCESYWQYKGVLFKMHAEHIKATLMGTEKSVVCERLRKNLITAMQFGGVLAISFGHL